MRKFNSVIAVLVLAGFAVFLMVEGADAFCVYNKTALDYVHAYQTSGGNFDEYIPTGSSKCCNWSEKSCNKGGTRTSKVKIRVDKTNVPYTTICEKEFDAGGWLEVTGDYRTSYSCSAHNVNVSPPTPKPKPGF